MERKKVLTILNNNHTQNQSVIDFLHKHFKLCQVDAIFSELPDNKSEKRVGDHFKTLVTNSPSYYDSNNRYKLLSNDPYSEEDIASYSYYDLVVLTQYAYDQILFGSEASFSNLPALVVPNNFKNQIKHVVFISTDSGNKIPGFKNFCYLFPTLCKESESVLLHILMGEEDKNASKNERLLYEYLRTKCEHLSIHKVEGALHDVDKRVLNLNNETLIVTDKQGVDLKSVFNIDKNVVHDYTLFKAS